MKYLITFLLLLLAVQVHSAETKATPKATRVNMQTNVGTIVIELNAKKAPQTVENFLKYVNEGFYDGTIFHRVIDGFMIQGGGVTSTYEPKKSKEPHAPITNEANNGLKNVRGTIAMARTSQPHSATSQFFINVKDNSFLNYKEPTPWKWGYAVFGKVVEGMEVVDRIKQVKTGRGGPFSKDVPQKPIIIEKVSVVEEKSADAKIEESADKSE